MTTTRSTEERISQWLEEAAVGQLPDRVLDATFDTTRGLRQSRASAWRPFTMSRPIPAMVAVGAAAIIVVAGVLYFRPSPTSNVGGQQPGTSPTTSTSPSISPTSSASLDPSSWVTYRSSLYGFDIGHPDDWTVSPAERAWEIETDAKDWQSPATEDFISPAGDVRVSAWLIPVDPGTNFEPGTTAEGWAVVETWIKEIYCAKTAPPCTVTRDLVVPLCVEVRDCHPGLLILGPDEVQAFFTGGGVGGMVAVTVWRPDADPSAARYGGSRQLLEAYLSTMGVWPADSIEGHAASAISFGAGRPPPTSSPEAS